MGFFYIFLIFFSINSFPGTILKSAVCPNVTESTRSILGKISLLKAQLKNTEECRSLSQKLESLSPIISSPKWLEVRAALQSGNRVSFEGDEISQISLLAQNASSLLTETIQSIKGKQSCLQKEQRVSFLSNFSGVIREVSQIIGNVTGPYGLAVNLGGNLLSGAILGIDTILRQKKMNFKDTKQELLFMNQYCSFSEIQKDINDYLTLEEREDELSILDHFLTTKLSDLITNCPECKGLKLAWNTKMKVQKNVAKIKARSKIIKLGDDRNSKVYTRCKEIHRTFHTTDSDFKILMRTLKNYKNPMSSQSDIDLMKEIVFSSESLSSNFPKLSTCLKMDLKKKITIAHEFNSLMRDEILPIIDDFFTQHIKELLFISDKIKYKNPLGDYTVKSLLRKKWISSEKERVYKLLSNPNYQISKGQLIEDGEYLEYKINSKMMPRYLRFLSKTSDDVLKKLRKNYQEPKINAQDSRSKLAREKKIRIKLTKAISRTRTIIRYCDFDRYMLSSTFSEKSGCNLAIESLKKSFLKISKLSKKIHDYLVDQDIFRKLPNYLYQSSRVSDYTNRVDAWNRRGSERWCLKKQLYLKKNLPIPVECL